tara:strand:- start:5741 stop:5923 length:183 start_codon:yes stop_codon:yes gene_type:complete
VTKKVFESEVTISFIGNRLLADDLDDYKQLLIESFKLDHEMDITDDDIVNVVEITDENNN